MRRLAAAAVAAVVATAGIAEARHRHHRHRHHHAPADLVTVETAAGDIRVSVTIAESMVGFIAEVIDRDPDMEGRVHCFATGGHMRRSLHYSGTACDFAQRARDKTAAVMYDVRDLAEKWGLRDGCTFRRSDCGHVDAGRRWARHGG